MVSELEAGLYPKVVSEHRVWLQQLNIVLLEQAALELDILYNVVSLWSAGRNETRI